MKKLSSKGSKLLGNQHAVDCLLPKFNAKTVNQVVDALMKGDDAAGPPTGRVLVNPIEMRPHPEASQTVWARFESLPSQTRPQRGAKPAKRLTAFAHELASDDILTAAGKIAHEAMHQALDKFQASYKDKVEASRKAVLTVDGKTVVADLKGKSKTFDEFWEEADMAVIDDAYRRAARVFSPDIARSYVDALAYRVSDPEDADAFEEALIESRVSVAALGLVTEVQSYFDSEADRLAKQWLATYGPAIKKLSHDRQESYRQIREMSAEPQDVELLKPEGRFEPAKVRENGSETTLPTYRNHLLCDEKGLFPAGLNEWEMQVVDSEMKRDGFKFWYRNPQQPGQSSLGIAYPILDQYGIIRPDFIFFAELEDGTVVADIVDPHGIHLADALPKLQGLAVYGKTHAASYRNIKSVAKALGKLRVLDLTRDEVRQAIAAAEDATTLFAGPLATDY